MSRSQYIKNLSVVQYAALLPGSVYVFPGVDPGIDPDFDLAFPLVNSLGEFGFDLYDDADPDPDFSVLDEYAHSGIDEERSGASTAGDRAKRGLSMAHISPFTPSLEYIAGASTVRVVARPVRVMDKELPSGGLRGLATFSAASRRRLKAILATVRRDCKPLFVTLTYPADFPLDPTIYKRDLDTLFKRVTRRYPDASIVWKLEPQKRGAPHYHFFIWGVDFEDFYAWLPYQWHDIAGSGDPYHLLFHLGQLEDEDNVHCVQEVRDFRGVMSYAAKYMSKAISHMSEYWVAVGRWWGVVGRKFLPVGVMGSIKITYAQALDLMRLARKAARYPVYKTVFMPSLGRRVRVQVNKKYVILKYRPLRAFQNSSLRIFTDADNFIKSVSKMLFDTQNIDLDPKNGSNYCV